MRHRPSVSDPSNHVNPRAAKRLNAVSLLGLCAAWLSCGCVAPVDLAALQMGRPEGYRGGGPNPFRAEIAARVAAEPPGDYFVGRRYYKRQYKFWGYVKEPGAPWHAAQLVMLNEQQVYAPDRASNNIGTDDGAEYRLRGAFTGETVYEPASNGFYPEFRVDGMELIDRSPPPVFLHGQPNDPSSLLIQRPQ